MQNVRRRQLALGTTLAVSLAMGVFATGAFASTSSSSPGGNAAATNYGFKCDANYNWLHQNWPNISVRSSSNQLVYTWSTLYEYENVWVRGPKRRHKHKHKRKRRRWRLEQQWVAVHTSQRYVGVSNVTGRKVLGYTAGGLPYYFAIEGKPSLVPPNDGYSFTNLPDASFRTVEEYEAGGEQWSADSFSQWDSVTGYCSV